MGVIHIHSTWEITLIQILPVGFAKMITGKVRNQHQLGKVK